MFAVVIELISKSIQFNTIRDEGYVKVPAVGVEWNIT
jgi:hypothetical protein